MKKQILSRQFTTNGLNICLLIFHLLFVLLVAMYNFFILVLWIRIGFLADPDPGSQTEPVQILTLLKFEFLYEKYTLS
jgi:hypothetical protein